MNVLHVVPTLDPTAGGPVTAVLGMAEALAAVGVNVRVAATSHGRPAWPQDAPYEVRLFRCRFCPWRWSPALERWLRAETAWADLVHVHTLWLHPTLAAGAASRAHHVPYILRPAGMLEQWSMSRGPLKKRFYGRAFEFPNLRGARALHWTSEEERDRSFRWVQDVPAFVAPLGLSPAFTTRVPDPDRFRRRHPELSGSRIILFLGRVDPKKGPDVAIRSLALVRARHPEAVLVVAGPGQPRYLRALAALARESGQEQAVRFDGLLTSDEVRDALAAASAFVLPSQQENFAQSVSEAMATACPVVVSPAVALAGAVAANGAGMVAEPTAAGVAAALTTLLDDEAGRKAAGERGRSYALAHLTWPRIAPRLLEAYEGLVSPRVSQGAPAGGAS